MTTLDKREAAAILEVHPEYINQLVVAGKLTPLKKVGTSNVFALEEIERFKRERKPQGRPKKARSEEPKEQSKKQDVKDAK